MKPIKLQFVNGYRSSHRGRDIARVISDWERTRNLGSVRKRKVQISNNGFGTTDRESLLGGTNR